MLGRQEQDKQSMFLLSQGKTSSSTPFFMIILVQDRLRNLLPARPRTHGPIAAANTKVANTNNTPDSPIQLPRFQVQWVRRINLLFKSTAGTVTTIDSDDPTLY
jgi:hypothetical protein